MVSYTTVSPLPIFIGGLLSVALARGLLRVGVTHRFALWSPDFPRYFHNAVIRATRFQFYCFIIGTMKLRLVLISSLLLLSACGGAKPAATPMPTNTASASDRKVPASCEIPSVNAAFAIVIPPSQYIPTEWKPAAGTDLYEAINAGGIACSYGDQNAEVGGTVIWALDKNNLWQSRVKEWQKEGMVRVEIPNIDEMDAYRLPDGATSADGMPAWKVNLLIHGVWIQLGAAFIQSWDEATPILRAAINATQ